MHGREFEDSYGWYFVIARDAGCSINSFGTWSSIKSLFVHCEATAVSSLFSSLWRIHAYLVFLGAYISCAVFR